MKKTLVCLLSVLLTLCLFVGCMFDVGKRSTYKRIEVSKQPNRDVFVYYNDGSISQQFDFTGLEVRGFKNESDTEGVDITKYCYVYSPRLSSGTLVTESLKGTHELTVYYAQGGETLTTTFDIEVIEGSGYIMKGGDWYEDFSDPNIGNITSITFTKEKPVSITTDGVDVTQDKTGLIMGYISGNDIYFVGDYFIGNEECTSMFGSFSSLTAINGLKFFDTSLVKYMNNMFSDCSSLKSLDLSNFDTSNVTKINGMFSGCSSIEELDLSSFDISKIDNSEGMGRMFIGCKKLTSLNLCSFDTSKIKAMYSMFCNCESLQSLDLSSFDTSNVTTMKGMFDGCKNLTSLILSNFDTSKVTLMCYMFQGCSSVESLDLSSFNTSNATEMMGMFSGCTNLSTITVGSQWTTDGKTTTEMFKDCATDHVTLQTL